MCVRACTYVHVRESEMTPVSAHLEEGGVASLVHETLMLVSDTALSHCAEGVFQGTYMFISLYQAFFFHIIIQVVATNCMYNLYSMIITCVMLYLTMYM